MCPPSRDSFGVLVTSSSFQVFCLLLYYSRRMRGTSTAISLAPDRIHKTLRLVDLKGSDLNDARQNACRPREKRVSQCAAKRQLGEASVTATLAVMPRCPPSLPPFLTPLITWSGPTCWNRIKLAEATPSPAAAALTVVLTIAFAAVCELPVMYSVLLVESFGGSREFVVDGDWEAEVAGVVWEYYHEIKRGKVVQSSTRARLSLAAGRTGNSLKRQISASMFQRAKLNGGSTVIGHQSGWRVTTGLGSIPYSGVKIL